MENTKARQYNKCSATVLTGELFPNEYALIFYIASKDNVDCEVILNDAFMKEQLDYVKSRITCVGFFGGDYNRQEIINCAQYVKVNYPKLKIGLYSEMESFPYNHGIFDYIKLGKYDCTIRSKQSKQRYYVNIDSGNSRRDYVNACFVDRTDDLWRQKSMLDPDYFTEEEKEAARINRSKIYERLQSDDFTWQRTIKQ